MSFFGLGCLFGRDFEEVKIGSIDAIKSGCGADGPKDVFDFLAFD